jgi:hypothetical protein
MIKKKEAILFLGLFGIVFITSCNKCYHCSIPAANEQQTFCKGSQTYDLLKRGQTLVDVNGTAYTCTLQ